MAGPAIGAVEDGHQFMGGNPADPNAWKPVQPQSAPQGQGLLAPQAQGQAGMIDALPMIHAIMPDLAKGLIEHPAYKQAQKAAEVQQRMQMAKQFGMSPNTPEGKEYILTGQIPKFERNYPAIQKADQRTTDLGNSLDTARTAMDLSQKAYAGPLADTRAMIGGWFGATSAVDTQNYQAAAKLLSQEIAKANSGGRVNAFEQKLMSELQGGLGQAPAARKEIIGRAIAHLEKQQALAERQADEIRNGTYYQPRGNPAPAPSNVYEKNGFKMEPME